MRRPAGRRRPDLDVVGRRGLHFRGDLGTLNERAHVMVELGNMRNPRDARRMTTTGGRATYAGALTRAARHFLH